MHGKHLIVTTQKVRLKDIWSLKYKEDDTELQKLYCQKKTEWSSF